MRIKGVVLTSGLVVALATSGCDDIKKSASDQGKAALSAAQSGADEAAKRGKEEFVKPINEMLPKIEDKIKGLAGDAKTKATEKLGELKTLLKDFIAAAPDKMGDYKDKITKAFDELKKLVGL